MTDIRAILWDYDDTLMDTLEVNMDVTIRVLSHFDPDIRDHLPDALAARENYLKADHDSRNWTDLYVRYFHFPEEQLGPAEELWGPEQKNCTVKPRLFDGLDTLIPSLQGIPMGICSQNDADNIRRTLASFHLDQYFGAVIGAMEVPLDHHKPDPYGFLRCIRQLGLEDSPGPFLYIGDHPGDVMFARNARSSLRKEVCCVTIDHRRRYEGEWERWDPRPDAYVQSADELRRLLQETYGIGISL